jgi:hypothetical protein
LIRRCRDHFAQSIFPARTSLELEANGL